MSTIKSSNLGYPRIGQHREWKKALEAHWAGKMEEKDLLAEMERIRLDHLQRQNDLGLDLIPVNDFTYYDHMLDMSIMFGLVPSRFPYTGGAVPLSVYFAMARGEQDAVACEMTKWFDTNYHYIVPELHEAKPTFTENLPLKAYMEAKQKLGIEGKPVVVGPYTFLKLAKGYEPHRFQEKVEQFLPLYKQMLQELEQEGVQWVQIDEPSLVTSCSKEDMDIVAHMYRQLKEAAPTLKIMLQTYFDAVEHYEDIIQLPVQGIGLDFALGEKENLASLAQIGFPKDKILGVGLIDGRNIWRASLKGKLNLLDHIGLHVPSERMIIQPSCSLVHVPVQNNEDHLESALKDALAFAVEKIEEIVCLTQAKQVGEHQVIRQIEDSERALQELHRSSARNVAHVHQAVQQLTEEDANRKEPFEKRRVLQQEKWNLPLLPTTTIGSLPQTQEVRRTRMKWRKGELDDQTYEQFIQQKTKVWIDIQEDIDLDVLVHGEFERTDMVEFFGQKLPGFAFTKNAWVQSYGSRCVKPPIIYGDVSFKEPMTVKESLFALSQTDRPVKGMLTGPITILNWSFVRDDLPQSEVAYQIALALRKEVEALEQAGIHMIQVDEPALREGMPLKEKNREAYLVWSVYAFKLATSTVQDTTQIHTHMCYCEFHDIIGAIEEMDADVISLETSRSHGEMIERLKHNAYNKGIGLGVYDIHSPRVPTVEEMEQIIDDCLTVLNPELFWVNPDCGLKTRGDEETIEALRHMVEATKRVREKRLSPTK